MSYSDVNYWNKRQNENILHEWYYSFEHLKPLLLNYIKETNNFLCLEIGCGNAPLLEGMINSGININGKLIGIDFSTAIIESLQKSNENDKIIYEVMDARNLRYEDNKFDIVIDKGTIDAMLCSDNWNENVELILNQMCRVLKNEGQVVIVSHLHFESDEFQEIMNEILVPILGNYSTNRVWNIDVHCTESTNDNNNSDEDEDEGEDEQENNGASVYIISSRNRRVTRSSTQGKTLPVQIKVMTYDSES